MYLMDVMVWHGMAWLGVAWCVVWCGNYCICSAVFVDYSTLADTRDTNEDSHIWYLIKLPSIK